MLELAEKGLMSIIQRLWQKLCRYPLQANVFLAFALPFGLLFVFVSAPFQPPDEAQHYWRAYEISSLHFHTQRFNDGRYGYIVPVPVKSMVLDSQAGRQPFAKANLEVIRKYTRQQDTSLKVKVYYENTAIYPPTSYIAQSTGIGISRVLHLPLLYGFYMARLLNLFVFIALVFAALCILPFAKWSMLALALLPMSLYEAASLSPDSLIIGLSLFAVAYFLRLYGQKRVEKRDIALSTLIVGLLSLAKQSYFVITLPFLFLHKKISPNRSRQFLYLSMLLFTILGLTVAWNLIVAGASSQIPSVLRPEDNINFSEQVKNMATHPFGFIRVLLVTVLFKASSLIITTGIGVFGYFDIGIPSYCYYLVTALFVVALIKDGSAKLPRYLDRKLRFILISSAAAITLMICAALYAGYTVVNNGKIEGLQGRYFLPALALLLPSLVSRSFRAHINEAKFIALFCTITLIVLISSLFALIDANYLRLLYPSY